MGKAWTLAPKHACYCEHCDRVFYVSAVTGDTSDIVQERAYYIHTITVPACEGEQSSVLVDTSQLELV